MLVLARKVNQEIRIGRDIVIRVLTVQGNAVRLGIEAPRTVMVMRSELGGPDMGKTFDRIVGSLRKKGGRP
jgi:carbon storage regulator CsrA